MDMQEQNVVVEQENSLPSKITKENTNGKQNKKQQLLMYVKTVLFLIASSLLVSVAAYALIAPNQFTIGGISGIAILINVATSGAVKQSWLVFCINLPLVVLSFFLVKKKFALLTAANIGLQTLWMLLIETFFPEFVLDFTGSGERIFAAIASGLCIGTAVALAFKIGGSTGGADILMVLIQRKIAASSIAWLLFGFNCIVIGASFFVFYDSGDPLSANVLPIMMSVFESYIESKINDGITNGFQSAIEFRIITDKPEEMSAALMKELSRGVTSLPATGMYTKKEHAMLFCVVNRRQVTTLRRVMKAIDPDSFAIMASVSQVLGLGFYTGEV